MLTWDEVIEPNSGPLAHYQIIRRNGAVVPFEPSKISIAMMNAFIALHGTCTFNGSPSFLHGNLPSSLLFATSIFKRWMFATASSTKQHLFALSKLVGGTIKSQPSKANGFFSASKANLRNAP
ncbi:MAG: hypothetical protein ABIP34_08275 [Rhodoferax sp.]|uniref:hypothetical protein n=1 Tax=Rhodoferax sp. TaxID=50421 RepID=UPI0032648BEE